MITMFLQGLRSFLMVSAYRKTSSLAQRLGTVETRVHALIPMAEQWSRSGVSNDPLLVTFCRSKEGCVRG